MKIAIAQINTRTGDVRGNTVKVREFTARAKDAGAELAVFPELAVPGYPPHDYLERPVFLDACDASLNELLPHSRGIGIVVGTVVRNLADVGKPVFNSACLLSEGEIVGVQHKTLLPTYDVFDESRYFEPATVHRPFEFRGRCLGLSVCEDIWNDKSFWQRPLYRIDPIDELVRGGVDILINISASPFSIGRHAVRRPLLAAAAHKHGVPLLYVNLVGGNDSLIFPGKSMVFSPEGRLVHECRAFEEDLEIVDTDALPDAAVPDLAGTTAQLHDALVLGLRDYTHKCGFKSVVFGLSGGIDSSIVACIAAEALGPENVYGISMPSCYSSQGSKDDARALAENLGINYLVIPIEPARLTFDEMLAEGFAGREPDVTEENIQARIRGVLVMALSNKFGHLALATGNKSELSMGYSTLYGDMCGGLTVIGDVPKVMVYELARYINRDRKMIPEDVLTKPPSAELRPNQTDQDSLPPYELLDQILKLYIEEHREEEEIAREGFDHDTVRRVLKTVDRVEYKRRQSAPVLRVTTKAFGTGRRLPIAQGWR